MARCDDGGGDESAHASFNAEEAKQLLLPSNKAAVHGLGGALAPAADTESL